MIVEHLVTIENGGAELVSIAKGKTAVRAIAPRIQQGQPSTANLNLVERARINRANRLRQPVQYQQDRSFTPALMAA